MTTSMRRPEGVVAPRQWRRVLAATAALASATALCASTFTQQAMAADGGTGGATTYAGSPAQAANAPHTATVDWLVSQLTVDEKLQLVKGGSDTNPHGQAGIILGVPRLGIPTIRHVDAQGINVYADSTAYPGRIGLASSFDRDAFSTFGQAVGKEGRALDVDLIYGPQVDMARMPTWSRNMTTDGEDPYLAGQLTSREINGIQSQGLMSQVKHFTLYNGQNQSTPSIVGDQASHEIYFPATEAAVKDAGVTSVMCSYANFQIREVESQPDYACSNSGALNGVLKGLWDFRGWVTSDYGGSKATSDLLKGMDQEFATSNFAPAKLKPLVDPESETYDPAYGAALDESVARILYQYQRFGLLDDSSYPATAKTGVAPIGARPAFDKQAGITTARELAEETGVLLKNSGSELPLSRDDGSKIAVIGPTANLMPAAPGGERSRGFGDRNNVSPYDALSKDSGDATVSYTPGIDRIGTVVPAANLVTADTPDAPAGLTYTETDADNNVVGTGTVANLDGKQTNLVKGHTYTYTGFVDVPTSDTYQFWLARPVGTFSGDATQYNKGVNPGLQQGPNTGAGANTTLAIDGATQTLANPSTILPNTYPDGQSLNGQYLGFDNSGAAVPLTPGLHQVTLTYKPAANLAVTPTFRFSWAAQQADIDAAVAAAKSATQAVVFVDDANTTTVAGTVGTLGPNQDKLIQAVADANPHTTVVLNTNGAVQMPWLGSVRSVLEMWYPGQEGGTATANLLYGNANPSGKLPITFPASNAATPFGGHPERSTGVNGQITWSEGLEIGYRWYVDNDVQPLFAFGHGLSYSTFSYRDLSVKRTADSGLDVTVTVTNTSRTDGHAVPQVYVGPSSELPARIETTERKLVQFDRVDLAAGKSATVTMHVTPRDLSSWDTQTQSWVLGTGARTIGVGTSSADLVLTATADVEPTKPALSAPAVTVTSGVTVLDGTQYATGPVAISWTAASPTESLGGYSVLVDDQVVQTVPAGTTQATLAALPEGQHRIAVRALPVSEAVDGGAVTSAVVTVVVDQTGPAVTVTTPRKPGKIASWKTIKGTATDAAGVAEVRVSLVQKRAKGWFALTAKGWKKAPSRAKAVKKAVARTATLTGSTWKIKAPKLRAGKLVVTVTGSDRLGNASAPTIGGHRLR